MDDLKKPTALLAGTNIIFSVGSFAYFYKRLEQLQTENEEIKKDLVTLTEKLQKNNNEDLQTEEYLQSIQKEMKTLKKSHYEDDIQALACALKDNDITVKLPSQTKKTKKYKKYQSSSEEESSEEAPKKKNKNKKDKDVDDKELINLFKNKKSS